MPTDEAMMFGQMQGSANMENLEGKNITLKQKEDDNKLSFSKNNSRMANV